jgi:hypothetical protein
VLTDTATIVAGVDGSASLTQSLLTGISSDARFERGKMNSAKSILISSLRSGTKNGFAADSLQPALLLFTARTCG